MCTPSKNQRGHRKQGATVGGGAGQGAAVSLLVTITWTGQQLAEAALVCPADITGMGKHGVPPKAMPEVTMAFACSHQEHRSWSPESSDKPHIGTGYQVTGGILRTPGLEQAERDWGRLGAEGAGDEAAPPLSCPFLRHAPGA